MEAVVPGSHEGNRQTGLILVTPANRANTMDRGIALTVVWFDDDVVELEIRAGNGRFSGDARGYAAPGVAAELAAALRGFPRNAEDRRFFEIGTLDDHVAGGGAHFEFRCRDLAGHISILVRLRTDTRRDERAAAEFSIEVEAAAVDSFVAELERLPSRVGAIATLQAA